MAYTLGMAGGAQTDAYHAEAAQQRAAGSQQCAEPLVALDRRACVRAVDDETAACRLACGLNIIAWLSHACTVSCGITLVCSSHSEVRPCVHASHASLCDAHQRHSCPLFDGRFVHGLAPRNTPIRPPWPWLYRWRCTLSSLPAMRLCASFALFECMPRCQWQYGLA